MKLFPFLALIPALLFAQTSKVWDGTAEQLAGLAAVVNRGTSFEGKTIKLGANIVLNDTTGWRNWDSTTIGLKQWTPIGTKDNDYSFKGYFEGNGKVVSGLYINTTFDYRGLLGNVDGISISNLGLVG